MKDIFLLVLILTAAAVFDLRTDKIPNWYIISASGLLLIQKIVLDQGFDFIGTFFSVLFPILILFPLFVLGLFGAADIKLLAMTGICFSFKDVMIIFVFSLFAGLIIGLVKAVRYRSFGERFKYLFRFAKNMFIRLRMRDMDVLNEPYFETLDKEMLKKGSIHFSLPILLGVIIKLIGG